jgi:hypothetical protein
MMVITREIADDSQVDHLCEVIFSTRSGRNPYENWNETPPFVRLSIGEF